MRVLHGTARIVTAMTLIWLLAGGSIVYAQQRGTTSGTGIGGTTGGGTSSTAGRTTGTSSSSGTLGGRSAAGGQGGALTGQGQGMGQPEFRTFGGGLDQTASGFGGRGAADAFAAQQAGGQQFGGQQNIGFGGGSQLGGLGAAFLGAQGGGRGSTIPGTGQTTTRSRAEQLRPRHRVAFSFSPVPSAQVTSRLRTHLRPLQGRIRGAQYSLDAQGTLTLQGTAASIDERKLAEAVARLEPGVRRIDNQIVVPQASDLSAQPPSLP